MSMLQIRIFDGTRQLFSAPAQFLITITDGNRTQRVRNFYPDNDITFDLPFFDNFGDNYTVLVWTDGYQQAGFTPVTLSDKAAKVLDVMLIPKDPSFSFAAATWDAASASYPFLGGDVDSATAATRYSNLMENDEKVLACILNLGEAMSQIALPGGSTASAMALSSSSGEMMTARSIQPRIRTCLALNATTRPLLRHSARNGILPAFR